MTIGDTSAWLGDRYVRRNIGYEDPIKDHLLNKQQVNSLQPIIAELSPTLNAYFRSVNQAALDQRKQSTKNKA